MGAVLITCEPDFDVLGFVDVRLFDCGLMILPSCWWQRLRLLSSHGTGVLLFPYVSRRILDYAIMDLAHPWAAQYRWFLLRCSYPITAHLTVKSRSFTVLAVCNLLQFNHGRFTVYSFPCGSPAVVLYADAKDTSPALASVTWCAP